MRNKHIKYLKKDLRGIDTLVVGHGEGTGERGRRDFCPSGMLNHMTIY